MSALKLRHSLAASRAERYPATPPETHRLGCGNPFLKVFKRPTVVIDMSVITNDAAMIAVLFRRDTIEVAARRGPIVQ